jgi:hypothetical protein
MADFNEFGQLIVNTFPTEAQFRANEGEVFNLRRDNRSLNLWFDTYEWGEAFSLGSADDGDCGDSYPTWDELIEALRAEFGIEPNDAG